MKSLSTRSVRTRWVLFVAFGVILVLLGVRIIVSDRYERRVRDEIGAILQSAVTSIVLIDRIGDDIENEYRLMSAYIRTHTPEQQAAIEAELNRGEKDLNAAAVEYDRFTTFPGERAVWQQLLSDRSNLQTDLARIRMLVRENQPEQARAMLERIEDKYTRIDDEMAQLTQINRREAEATQARIATIQSAAIDLAAALGIIGLLITGAIGLAAIMLVGRRERRLEQYASELELRNQELDAFAGRVAHDLRGPLTMLNMATSQLERRVPDEEGTTSMFRRAVVRMERLIQDLLSLSRIDTYARRAHCDPHPVSDELAQELQPRLREKGASRHGDLRPAAHQSSRGRRRQALWNLADNALSYSRPGVQPAVDIRGRVRDDHYELRVADNGPGIPAEEQQRIFEPFYRGTQTTEQPGTGLGLSIVRRVIEANEGRISISSQPGKGTTFVIDLPLGARESSPTER
jgi:signal transduction histidine kinase